MRSPARQKRRANRLPRLKPQLGGEECPEHTSGNPILGSASHVLLRVLPYSGSGYPAREERLRGITGRGLFGDRLILFRGFLWFLSFWAFGIPLLELPDSLALSYAGD